MSDQVSKQITVERYMANLCTSMPPFVQEMIHYGLMEFDVDVDGYLVWRFDVQVPKDRRRAASDFIKRWTRRNPLVILEKETIH